MQWLLPHSRNVCRLLNVSFKSEQIEGFSAKQFCTLRPSQVQTADFVFSDRLYNFWHHRNGATNSKPRDNTRTLFEKEEEEGAALKSDCHSAITRRDNTKCSPHHNQEWGILSLGTCAPDYHLLPEVEDKPNHHQSSSLYCFPPGMLLFDTEKKTFKGCREYIKNLNLLVLQLETSTKTPTTQ